METLTRLYKQRACIKIPNKYSVSIKENTFHRNLPAAKNILAQITLHAWWFWNGDY